MKKLSILIILLTSFSYIGNAQNSDILNGVFIKEHVPIRKPVPYYYLREADVAWSKVIWRRLDLREKLNHPLYYPTVPTDDRVSLVTLMVNGVKDEGIRVYDFDEANEFATPITLEKVLEDLGAGKDSMEDEDPVTGVFSMKYTDKEPRPDQVTRLLMKEEWFFNRQRSKMEVRIIGLCPVRRYTKESNAAGMDDADAELTLKTLFWAYFPSYRTLFANQEVFNPFNDAERRTFDDIFFKRRFSSYIYRITNVYDNRTIQTYKKGEDVLLEAERMKDFLFKFEHDLWEF